MKSLKNYHSSVALSRKTGADFVIWTDEEKYEQQRYRKHDHNFYQVVFARKGPVSYTVRNTTMQLQTRDFLIIPPGELHAPVSGQKKGGFTAWEIKFFMLDDIHNVFRFADRYQVIAIRKNNLDLFVSLMEAVIREYRTRKAHYTAALHGLLVNIFIMLERERRVGTRRTAEPPEPGTSLMENRKRNIAIYAEEYITTRYHTQIRFGQMARKLNVSLSYFSEIFKELNKMTPVEYLNAVRLDKAKELMKTSELNFSQIAEAVGYRNVQYFSRIFKEKQRITPSRYRRFINENLYRYDGKQHQ